MIRPEDVARVFDDARILELAKLLARLPTENDLTRFGESVRWAMQNYIARAAEPTPNALYREIAALHQAAERCEYDRLAALIEGMTSAARTMIEGRRRFIAERAEESARYRVRHGRAFACPELTWRIPDPEDLHNTARRERAAENFRPLLVMGAAFHARKRLSGKPTISVMPRLYAPRPSRAEPRRAAERELVMGLQLAIAETAAEVALTARTADAGRNAGPFARMVARVLQISGACRGGAEGRAVRAINDLHKARKEMQRRHPRPAD